MENSWPSRFWNLDFTTPDEKFEVPLLALFWHFWACNYKGGDSKPTPPFLEQHREIIEDIKIPVKIEHWKKFEDWVWRLSDSTHERWCQLTGRVFSMSLFDRDGVKALQTIFYIFRDGHSEHFIEPEGYFGEFQQIFKTLSMNVIFL